MKQRDTPKTLRMLDDVATRLHMTRALIRKWIGRRTRPTTRPVLGYLLDRERSREDLIRENALLRKQLEIACRQLRRPQLHRTDRVALVLLARLSSTWRHAVLLVQPETILRWHRQGFALLWRRRVQRRGGAPRVAAETIALIEHMARSNRLWGAERIRGELLKLDIRVAKRTIQKLLRRVRGLDRLASGGRPSFATTPTRPGRATSCRPTTRSSARSSRSSCSKSGRGASYTSRSPGRRRARG
jgi:hypothetical protein